jgi:FixJ family two-component response regulator
MDEAKAVVHVVEDDDSVRTAVVRLLRTAGFQAQPYASAAEFLLVAGENAGGCMVLDVGLPGMSGIELHAALAKRRDCSVVFLTGRGDVQMSVRAMKDGAVDFLDKPVKRELLLDAVARAVERDVASRERRERASELRARYELLTERERQVFRLVAEGRLNKQIADVVGASLRTVKSHRARVMEKMHATTAADLVRAADELGRLGMH